jgi:osmotically-inducible protein OsmY
MEVRLAGARKDDSDIARAIAHVVEWNTNIPTGQVKARVDSGWVTLEGTVDYGFQRKEVERMVRHVSGVVGIADDVEVSPPVSETQIEAKIAEAMRRHAELDARSIKVEFSDHTAKLYGHVHSLHEALAARVAAASAPGVAQVESHLQVLP